MTSSDSKTLLLRGARVVLPEAITGPGEVLVEDGRIVLIEEGGVAVPVREMRTIDLDGLTLYPGFIDVHIHGAMGVDSMEASPDELRRIARFLVQNGVTSWLPTLVPAAAQDYFRVVSAIEGLMRMQDEHADGARALGLHYEGPFVNTAQCGALRSDHFRVFNDSNELESLPMIENRAAKHMMTIAPEIEGGIELVRELLKRRWTVSIGHTRADVEELDRARDAGARHMTHFMNAMTPLHHRTPGPVGWGLLNDEVTCDVIADGVHLHPLVLKLLLRSKTAERISLISDSVAPAGLGDGEYKIWGETISVHEGRTRNERGSIAGSVITMLDAVRMMMSLGATEVEIARMSSTNPARLLGVDDICGSIEEGKRADLVALDDKENVRLTVVGGRVMSESL